MMYNDNYEDINRLQVDSETDPFTIERYRQFHKHFPLNVKKVLDIGCNTGRGGQALLGLDPSLELIGLDVVEDRLHRLKESGYQEGLYGSCTDIPSDDCVYDVVVAGEFVEHLYPRDVDATLNEIFRILKIGGRLLLTTPNPEDIKRQARKQSVLNSAHLSQHFYNMMRLRLKMSGYSNVKIYGSGKMTRYIGERFPWLKIYGSYLAIGDKF